MTTTMYVGVDDKARKVKKMYTGVDDVARQVKKAYIGVGGVARPFFSGDIEVLFEYYGKITPLSEARFMSTVGNVGDYVLFAGGAFGLWGEYGDILTTLTVDAYSSKLVRSTPSPLQRASEMYEGEFEGVYEQTSVRFGDYAVFWGGESIVYGSSEGEDYSYRSDWRAMGNAYDSKLLRHDLPENGTDDTNLPVGATAGGYVIFCGGSVYHDSGTNSGEVFAYTENLSNVGVEALSIARTYMAASSVGDYALFAGGTYYWENTSYATVDAYDINLVHTLPTELSVARDCLKGAKVEGYCLFAGGYVTDEGDGGYSDVVDVYDSTLVRRQAPPLSESGEPTSLEYNGKAYFFNGDFIDVYDANLVRTTYGKPQDNEVLDNSYAIGVVGNYLLATGAFAESDDEPYLIPFDDVHTFTFLE